MWNPIFCRALRCLLAVGGGDSGNAGCPGAQTSRLEGPFPRWPRCQWVVLPNGAATLQNLGRLAQLPLRSLLDVPQACWRVRRVIVRGMLDQQSRQLRFNASMVV